MFNKISILISLWLTTKCPHFLFFDQKNWKSPKNQGLSNPEKPWLILDASLNGVHGVYGIRRCHTFVKFQFLSSLDQRLKIIYNTHIKRTDLKS